MHPKGDANADTFQHAKGDSDLHEDANAQCHADLNAVDDKSLAKVINLVKARYEGGEFTKYCT